jgi:hypothetical protein
MPEASGRPRLPIADRSERKTNQSESGRVKGSRVAIHRLLEGAALALAYRRCRPSRRRLHPRSLRFRGRFPLCRGSSRGHVGSPVGGQLTRCRERITADSKGQILVSGNVSDTGLSKRDGPIKIPSVRGIGQCSKRSEHIGPQLDEELSSRGRSTIS